MDKRLLDQVIHLHGAEIVSHLQEEQEGISHILPSWLSLGHGTMQEYSRDSLFTWRLHRFISRKADVIFKEQHIQALPSLPDKEADEFYAVMPPLESFMEVPSLACRQHFYRSLEEGDILVGMVSAVQESGLIVTMLCMDNGKIRNVEDMKITTFCPLREVPKILSHEGPLEGFQIKDKVRGVVLSVNAENEKIIISLQPWSQPAGNTKMKIGLISDEELPVHYRRTCEMDDCCYSDELQGILGFSNPSNVNYLSDAMGITYDPPPSLMRGLHNVIVPKTDTAEHLRKEQSARLALKSVAQGVSEFKKGHHVEAMQHLNKALQIDEENVEALVARGALYANTESYSRAIEDFEQALDINPHHSNARKYMCETLTAKGKSLAEKKRCADAAECFQRALSINATYQQARESLARLQQDRLIPAESNPKDGSEKAPIEVSPEPAIDPEKSYYEKTTEALRKLIEAEKEHKHKKRKKKRLSEDGGSPNRSHSRVEEDDEEDEQTAKRRRLSQDDPGDARHKTERSDYETSRTTKGSENEKYKTPKSKTKDSSKSSSRSTQRSPSPETHEISQGRDLGERSEEDSRGHQIHPHDVVPRDDTRGHFYEKSQSDGILNKEAAMAFIDQCQRKTSSSKGRNSDRRESSEYPRPSRRESDISDKKSAKVHERHRHSSSPEHISEKSKGERSRSLQKDAVGGHESRRHSSGHDLKRKRDRERSPRRSRSSERSRDRNYEPKSDERKLVADYEDRCIEPGQTFHDVKHVRVKSEPLSPSHRGSQTATSNSERLGQKLDRGSQSGDKKHRRISDEYLSPRSTKSKESSRSFNVADERSAEDLVPRQQGVVPYDVDEDEREATHADRRARRNIEGEFHIRVKVEEFDPQQVDDDHRHRYSESSLSKGELSPKDRRDPYVFAHSDNGRPYSHMGKSHPSVQETDVRRVQQQDSYRMKSEQDSWREHGDLENRDHATVENESFVKTEPRERETRYSHHHGRSVSPDDIRERLDLHHRHHSNSPSPSSIVKSETGSRDREHSGSLHHSGEGRHFHSPRRSGDDHGPQNDKQREQEDYQHSRDIDSRRVSPYKSEDSVSPRRSSGSGTLARSSEGHRRSEDIIDSTRNRRSESIHEERKVWKGDREKYQDLEKISRTVHNPAHAEIRESSNSYQTDAALKISHTEYDDSKKARDDEDEWLYSSKSPVQAEGSRWDLQGSRSDQGQDVRQTLLPDGHHRDSSENAHQGGKGQSSRRSSYERTTIERRESYESYTYHEKKESFRSKVEGHAKVTYEEERSSTKSSSYKEEKREVLLDDGNKRKKSRERSREDRRRSDGDKESPVTKRKGRSEDRHGDKRRRSSPSSRSTSSSSSSSSSSSTPSSQDGRKRSRAKKKRVPSKSDVRESVKKSKKSKSKKYSRESNSSDVEKSSSARKDTRKSYERSSSDRPKKTANEEGFSSPKDFKIKSPRSEVKERSKVKAEGERRKSWTDSADSRRSSLDSAKTKSVKAESEKAGSEKVRSEKKKKELEKSRKSLNEMESFLSMLKTKKKETLQDNKDVKKWLSSKKGP